MTTATWRRGPSSSQGACSSRRCCSPSACPGADTVPFLVASGVIHVAYVAALVAAQPCSPGWWRYLLAGGCVTGAYSLVLVAVRFAPVGYGPVLQESSIVLGAYTGRAFPRERLGDRLLRVSVAITAGLVAMILLR